MAVPRPSVCRLRLQLLILALLASDEAVDAEAEDEEQTDCDYDDKPECFGFVHANFIPARCLVYAYLLGGCTTLSEAVAVGFTRVARTVLAFGV